MKFRLKEAQFRTNHLYPHFRELCRVNKVGYADELCLSYLKFFFQSLAFTIIKGPTWYGCLID